MVNAGGSANDPSVRNINPTKKNAVKIRIP
jgi:hypothetical protein